jgi:hypothetical protein
VGSGRGARTGGACFFSDDKESLSRPGPFRAIAGQKAIVQSIKANPRVLQLPLEPFVAVQAQHRVKASRCKTSATDRSIGGPSLEVVLAEVVLTFGTKHPRFLLPFANKQDTFSCFNFLTTLFLR